MFSGPIRRFNRVCEHIQANLLAHKTPGSPRRRIANDISSDSSSCASESMSVGCERSPSSQASQDDVDIEVFREDARTPQVRRRSSEVSARPQLANGQPLEGQTDKVWLAAPGSGYGQVLDDIITWWQSWSDT